MATIHDIYTKAIAGGVLAPQVDEARFAKMLQNDSERRAFFDYAQENNPGFYSSDYDVFSRNAAALFENQPAEPATPTIEQPVSRKVKDNPAPLTEAEYQEGLQRQDAAQDIVPELQGVNITQDNPRKHITPPQDWDTDLQAPTMQIPTLGNDATRQDNTHLQDYEQRVPQDVHEHNQMVARKMEERRPEHERMWAQDKPIIDEIYQQAEQDANEYAQQAFGEQSRKMTPYNSADVYGDNFSGFMQTMREANEIKDPAKLISAFNARLDERMRERFGNDYNPQQATDENNEQLAFQLGQTPEDYKLYQQYVEQQLNQYFTDVNMPKSDMEYFVRKVIQANLLGQLYEIGTKPLSQRQYEMQGVGQYAQQNETTGLDVAAEVTNVALDLPLMAATGGVGGAAERGATRLLTRQLSHQLERRGMIEAGDMAARIMAQNTWYRAGMSALREGVTFSLLNTINAAGTDLYQQGELTPRTAIAGVEGLITGVALGGVRVPNNNIMSYLQDQYGRRIGTLLGTGNSFIARTNLMVGGQALGHVMNGESLNDFDWGNAYLHAGLMNMGFDLLGAGKVYFNNRAKSPNFRQAVSHTLNQMTADPNAHLFTNDDIAQLNRVGIEGRNVRELVDYILRTEGEQNPTRSEIDKYQFKDDPHIREIQTRLESIFTNPEIDTEVKGKLYQIFTGKPLMAYTINTDSKVEQEDGRYVVRTYDNAGMTYRTRTFDNLKDAERYRQRQVIETRPNLLNWCENIGATAFRARAQKEMTGQVVRQMADEMGITEQEVLALLKTTTDKTMRGANLTPDELSLSTRYVELMEEAERNITSGKVVFGKTPTVDANGNLITGEKNGVINDSDIVQAYNELLKGEKNKGFRTIFAKHYAAKRGISEQRVLDILNSRYDKLSDADRKIYDDYVEQLQLRIRPNKASAAEWADFEEYDPAALGNSPFAQERDENSGDKGTENNVQAGWIESLRAEYEEDRHYDPNTYGSMSFRSYLEYEIGRLEDSLRTGMTSNAEYTQERLGRLRTALESLGDAESIGGEITRAEPSAREQQIRADVERELGERVFGEGALMESQIITVSDPADPNRRGYVVSSESGNVPQTEQSGDKVVFSNGDDLVIVRWEVQDENGTHYEVSPQRPLKDFDYVGIEQASEVATQMVEERELAEQGKQTFQAGQQVWYTAPDTQQTYSTTVVNVTDEGVEIEITDAQGNPNTTIIPHGVAMTQLLTEDPNTEPPVEQPAVEPQTPPASQEPQQPQEPIVEQPQEPVQEATEPQVQQPIEPDSQTMSATELAAATVEYMEGDRMTAKAYLQAELDKAKKAAAAFNKQSVKNYANIADFKRQNDALNAQRKAANDLVSKLESAVIEAANYKTQAERAAAAAEQARQAEIREQRRQTEVAQAGSTPAERWNGTPRVVGNAVTRTLSDGTKIKGHYVLAEAGTATPSHDPFNNWNTSEGFPTTEDGRNINDRDYKNDKDAQQITQQIAQTYDGQAVEQVPVVSSEGIVYDGNGRTIAGHIAAANNTDTAYLEALAENAGNFGFTPEQLAQYEHPRVYLQTDEDLPYNTTTFAKFNAQEKKTQGGTARAVSNSKKLTEAGRDELLKISDNYGTLDAFFASEKGADDVVKSLLNNGIISQQEVAGLTERTDKGYLLSPTGKDYVTDLLLGALFDEQTIRLLGSDKGLKQSILRALPAIVENRRLGDYALSDDINGAIRLLYEARRAGMTYGEFIRQTNAFEGAVADRYSAFEMLLAEEMQAGVEQFRKVLNIYNQSAKDEANGQTGLFEPRTAEYIKQEILDYYAKQQPAATSNDSGRQESARGNGAEPPTKSSKPQTKPAVPSAQAGDGANGGRDDSGGSITRRKSKAANEEIDENGYPFVRASNGTTTFGEIRETSGLPAAPIRLSQGYQDDNGKGYGLAHIEANHGEQIRNAGFNSVEEFVSFVAQNYDEDNIRVGKRRAGGNATYLIQVTDSHDNTLFIELAQDGSYWNVNSAGIFRKGYSNKKETVAETEPQQPNNAVSGGSSLSAEATSGTASTEPNGEPTVSNGKDTTNNSTTQEGNEKTALETYRQAIARQKDAYDKVQSIGGALGAEENTQRDAAKAEHDNAVKEVYDAQTQLREALSDRTDDELKAMADQAEAEGDTLAREAYLDISRYRDRVANEQKQKQQKEQPKSESKNTIFTDEEAERVRARMRARRNRLNMGIDPEQFADGVFMAGYYVEKGMRKFADFARAMIKEFGDWVRPYLKQWYMGLRYDPRAVGQEFLKDMDDINTVDKFDVENFKVEEPKTEKKPQASLQPWEETPIGKQYKKIKEQYPDALLLFRAGDFYEMYSTDAEEGSKILGITLTRRSGGKDGIPLVGFPFHALDSYLPKLVRAGKRVAICDQLEDPKLTEKTVKRGVTELVAVDNDSQTEQSQDNSEKPLQNEKKGVILSAEEPTEDNPNLVIRHIGEIRKSKHTQTGEDLWIVSPTDRVSDEEFKQLKARARNNNGNYSSFKANKGFIFKSEEDANNFNNIEDERTTDETAANTVAIAGQGQAVAAEAEAIEPNRGRESEAAGEQRTESPAPSVGGVGTVEEKTPEEREPTITTAQRAIDKIDEAVEKADDQLALLGYYTAEEDPSKFHESYGYMRTAEVKAVADADRLAKQLAEDLGIKLPSKRKRLASANIAPAGGDISFRLPLEDGRELYLVVGVRPNNGYYSTYEFGGQRDDLAVTDLMWRVEDPSKGGMSRYLTSNQNYGLFSGQLLSVTYGELLRDIRTWAKDYLPKAEIAPNTTRNEIVAQAVEKQKKRKADKNAIQDGQQMLDLFADAVEDLNSANTEESAPEQEVQPINTTNNGDTEVRNDGQRESRTTQRRSAGQPADENGTLGGSQRQTDEGTDSRGVGARGEQHRLHDGERGLGTTGQSASKPVEEAPVAENDRKNTRNFRYDPADPAPTSNKARYEANLAAIRLLKQLQDEGRQATPEEQRVLAKFTGWGGLGEYFKGKPGTTYYASYGEKSPYQTIKELLTDDEMEAAQLSRNSAYYTPALVIDRLWDIAKQLGFKGGNILEGSAGIGNILAQMPQSISDRSNLQAVEIEPITAGILAQLYPDAQTHAAGFQEVNLPNNSQDLVITNVPFVTGLRVYDKQEKDLSKRFGNIHDFCIAKNVRKLRQGGLGIFITSSGTLDSSKDLRRWLNNEGETDVIGAFRLNRETFGGTSATSDIIVVRKRVNGQKDPRAIDVLDTMTDRVARQEQEETWNRKKGQWETPEAKEVKLVYNKYFVEHPEAMGGVMGFGFEHGDTRWGGTTAGCYADPTIDQNERLQQWVESLNVVGDTNETIPTIREEKQDNPLAQYESTTESHTYGELILNSKGQICKFANGYAVPVEEINPTKVKGHTKAEVLKDYNTIKSALDELLAAQTKDISDAELKPYLQKLNNAYNTFTRKYGNLNRNVSLSFLRNDVQWASIAALEDVKETVDANGKKKVEVNKTDVFTKRVVGVMPQPKAETTKDGVILSVQQFGVIRPDKIAEWLNKPAEEVEREIIESRLGFKDPQTGNIQVRHEYLSGNVREKLAYAEEHNENGEYDTNIDELRKVIPIDIPAHLIEFNIGSTWIPTELYQEYLKDKFDVTGIKLTHIGSAWVAGDLPWSGKNEKNRSEGVYSEKLGEQVYGSDLMIAAMNNVPLIVSRTEKHRDGTTETITDKEATAACSDKISQIKDDFVEWARGKMQQDSGLAERVQKIYNDRFNAIVPMMKVDDIFLSEHLPGQNHKYELYKHQQNAVVRATTQPIMLAHEVGTGKTITLISTAMEMRRLGTAKKPMIVVQNATTPQFVKEAKDLYPNAKILTVSERDRTREGRQEFYAKIKYNDWDLIIVPQSVFDMIPDSESRMRDFINEKIEEKIHAIEAAKEAGLDQKITNRMEKELENLREDLETNNMSGKRGKKATEKDAKKAAEQRANAEAHAQAMLDRKTDDVADFDDMGIDALLIDEAHNYKHLGFATMMTRGVKGIDPSYSKRAAALYLKCQSVYERQGHRNVVFATGTPISNTAAEIWTFMKYLMPKEVLKENDIYYFDDFVHNFGKINEQLEFQTNGKFKPNNRFSQYGNVPELMRMWLSCADCVLTREVGQVNDKVPEIENGGAQDIFLPQSPSLIDIMATVRAELERYENMSGKEKKENSHIPLTMYGIAKRAAIDPRLVDANAADEPLSKTNKAVEEVLRSLNDSKKYNGTAAIFCDSYQNKQSGFNLFQDIKDKLVKNGVPASKIAIIRSDMTDAAKQKIFDAVREGEIRVIMGSTQTLGTGVNIQTRLHTLIHMDAPDRPMDYTQRNGRIVRQGNMHKQWNIPVRILRFGVEDSLDVTSYQRLKTKAGFIDSIMNGKAMIDNNLENRVLEDVEEGIFDNPVAMLSGSQYALLKTQAERDLRKWSARKQQHNIDQILITDRLKKNGMIMQYRRNVIAQNEKFLQQLEQQFPNGKVDEYNIDGTICHNADELKVALKELNADIQARADKLRKEGYDGDKQSVSLTLVFNGVPFNVDILLTRKSSFKDGSRIISVDKEVYYSVQGGERIVSPTKVLDKLVEHIEQEHLSGKRAKADIKYSQDYIVRLEKENELMRQREGKPFAHEEELQKAQQLVDVYTEKMKEELAAKEAKYANLASGKKVELNEETDEEETDTPEAQYDELEYSSRELTEAERLAAQTEVESLLNNAGLQVTLETDEAEMPSDAEFARNSWISKKGIKQNPKLDRQEYGTIQHYVDTYKPNAKKGDEFGVYSANNYYLCTSNGYGEPLTVHTQIPINGNEDLISLLNNNNNAQVVETTRSISDAVEVLRLRERTAVSANADSNRGRELSVRNNGDADTAQTDRAGNVSDSQAVFHDQHPEILKQSNGKLFGWAQGNRIYITKDGFNPNSPVHEYSHLWIKAIKQNNAELYDNLMDLFSRKNLPQMYEELDNDPNYADLSEEGKMSEVFARFSGKRGAQRMTEEAQAMIDDAIENGTKQKVAQTATLIQRMKALLKKAWDWIGEHLFNIKNFGSREEAADRALYDMLNGTDLNLDGKGIDFAGIKEKTKENKSFMRAPNGRKSLLNENQWLTTRSEQFADWFGDWENNPKESSKAIDRNGEPIVVYHGTPYEFDIFKGEKGYFFFNKERLARQYENTRLTLGVAMRKKSTANTKPYFLNMRNPFEIVVNGKHDRINRYVVESALNGTPLDLSLKPEYIDSEDVVRMVKEKGGYDGVIFRSIADNIFEDDYERGDVYVVFEPSQVKLANGENITFGENDNIMFSIHTEPGSTPAASRTSGIVKSLLDKAEELNGQLKSAVQRNADGNNVDEIQRLQSEYSDFMQSALRLMRTDLKGLKDSQRLQKSYDKGTIDTLTAYAQMFIQSGWAEEATRTELSRLLGVMRNSATEKDIVPAVQKMLNMFTNTQLKQTKALFSSLLKTPLHKLNISGVREQGKVDLHTQYQLDEIKSILKQEGMTLEKIGERIDELQDKIEEHSDDDALRADYEARLNGAMIAQHYYEADGVVDKQQEAETLKQELKDAHADKSLSREAKQQLIESIERAMVENEQDQIIAYQQMNALLGDMLKGGKERAKSFLAGQKARQAEIHHFANSDLKGISPQEHRNDTREQRIDNSVFVSGGLFSPLGSLNSILKRLAPNALEGKGYLWQHFMYGTTEASEKEYEGLKQAFKELDDKVSEIWGKTMTFAEAERETRKMPKIRATIIDAGLDENEKATREVREIELTQGQAAYIYMVNKMTDGRMKLRKMGVKEEDVETIKEHLDPRVVELCDWLQQEYLVQKRNKYNTVHEKMFGAPMAAIENYFPLRLIQTSINKKEDVADNNAGKGQTSGTTTGAIKQRVRNALPLDVLHSDIFSVMIDHLQEMEHWAAYAQITRDANQLLSYNTFKRKLGNMSTVYGAGQQLYSHLKDALKLALGTYEAKSDKASAFTAQVAKGLSIGAISLRISTAIKQVLSHPAYWTEMTHPKFAMEYGKNLVHPYGAVKWGLENLPLLHKRWNSRAAGDTRILDNEDEWRYWHNHVVEWCTRIGMSPNAFIDMVTCAQGAKAYYEYKLQEYREAGMTREDAEKRARLDAEIFYNETQQSSEGAFVAPIQQDRSWTAIAMSLFNNANFAYQRRGVEHLYQLSRQIGDREKILAAQQKMYERVFGMDGDAARAKAESEYKHNIARNLIGIAIFGYIIQQIWRVGGNYLYLLVGDDDDEKKRIIEDGSHGGGLVAPVRGLLGGKELESLLDAYRNGTLAYTNGGTPLEQGIETIIRDVRYGTLAELANDMVDVMVGMGTGIRPSTISNMVLGVYDAIHAKTDGDPANDLEATREFWLSVGRVLSVPQSQLDLLYVDEFGCSGAELKKIVEGGDQKKVDALVERYVEYKKNMRLPLTGGHTFDEERDAKLDKRYVNRLREDLKDRVELHQEEAE